MAREADAAGRWPVSVITERDTVQDSGEDAVLRFVKNEVEYWFAVRNSRPKEIAASGTIAHMLLAMSEQTK
jgi:competence protein ComGC